MSNLYESIPPAVATIVTAFASRLVVATTEPEIAALQQRMVDLADRLARTFAIALDDAITKRI